MKISISTLGCKVNQYESQAMAAIFQNRGHELCGFDDGAAVYIINTCAVTEESGRKSRQLIRRAREKNPGAFIAVCGCFSQVSPDKAAELDVQLISGSGDRREFISRLEAALPALENKLILVDNALKRRSFEQLPAGSLKGRARAMLKIQDGCDNFCAYCIIPYARGPVRSMPLDDAATQAAGLKESGHREIVITGIEIASYGKELPGRPGLIDAVCAISGAAGGVRLRLGSLEPRCVTEEFVARLKALPGICNHFHLSLQSGCDETLRRMGRKYDSELFYRSVQLLRENFPGCAVTGDLITGFPGETDEEFEKTLTFINRCAFSKLHVFPYSPRPGTRAAEMPGQLPRQEKERRAKAASLAASETEGAFLKSQVGRTLDVLFEREKDGVMTGHSGNYCEVAAEGRAGRGSVRHVMITSAEGTLLHGRLI